MRAWRPGDRRRDCSTGHRGVADCHRVPGAVGDLVKLPGERGARAGCEDLRVATVTVGVRQAILAPDCEVRRAIASYIMSGHVGKIGDFRLVGRAVLTVSAQAFTAGQS